MCKGKIGQGLGAGRNHGSSVDVNLDLVRIDVEGVGLELLFKRHARCSPQRIRAREVVLIVFDIVEVLLEQFAV
ncbi:hypothetical protein D3C78_1816550 [compost metagenome]